MIAIRKHSGKLKVWSIEIPNAPYLNHFHKLNIKKLFNFLLLKLSYYISALTHKDFVWGKPVKVAIEPTNFCNLKCSECPTGTNGLSRPKGNMDTFLFSKIITSLPDEIISMIFYFQGEPFLNKQLFEMIKIARKQKKYTYCSTNGHFFSDENIKKTIGSGLNELIISLDGTTQEIYEKYRRGGNLETVLQGTKKLVAYKKQQKSKHPYIKFQFLVVKPNENQIPQAKMLAKNIGVDKIVFKTAQIYDYENGNELIPENLKFSRYKKAKDGKYHLKKKIKNHCWRLWSNPVITVKGDVLPCCFDKDAKYAMGNLNEQSFMEIWQGEKYKSFRKKVLNKRKSIDICRNCTE